MGTDCQVIVVGQRHQALLGHAVERIHELEQRWSRFVPESEISRLNSADGAEVRVSDDTMSLIEHAVLAWRLTGERFNPLMQRPLVALGYDRTFENLATDGQVWQRTGTHTATHTETQTQAQIEPPLPERLTIDRAAGMVRLPAGFGFDPGGIGKGLAADLVAGELIEAGAWGVLVNLGGDIRVIGAPPTGSSWTVRIAEPAVAPHSLATVHLTNAGLATSTTERRRWGANADHPERHHLLDPATAMPTLGGPKLASVIAGSAWWAEVSATALLVQAEYRMQDNTWALIVDADGIIERLGGFEAFEHEAAEAEPSHTR